MHITRNSLETVRGPADRSTRDFYIDTPDLDAAIAFASRIPVARMGGTVELRAMVER
jgi:hypothetical protein